MITICKYLGGRLTKEEPERLHGPGRSHGNCRTWARCQHSRLPEERLPFCTSDPSLHPSRAEQVWARGWSWDQGFPWGLEIGILFLGPNLSTAYARSPRGRSSYFLPAIRRSSPGSWSALPLALGPSSQVFLGPATSLA